MTKRDYKLYLQDILENMIMEEDFLKTRKQYMQL